MDSLHWAAPVLVPVTALLPAGVAAWRALRAPDCHRPRPAALEVGQAAVTALLAGLLFAATVPETSVAFIDGTWLEIGGLNIAWSLRWDALSRIWWFGVMLSAALHVLLARSVDNAQRGHTPPGISLLIPTAASLVVLAGDFLQVFAAWEWLLVCAVWTLARSAADDSGRRAARRLLLTALAADVLFLVGLVALWLTYGSFAFEHLLAPQNDPAGRTANTLVSLCVPAAALVRCGVFPACTWLLDSGAGSRSGPSIAVMSGLLPAALYLLFRCLPAIAAEPAAQALLTGLGALSVLAWGVLAAVHTEAPRGSVCFAAGTVAFVIVAIGTMAERASPALGMAISLVPPLNVLLALSTVIGRCATESAPWIEGAAPRATVLPAMALCALALGSGLLGQEAVVSSATAAADERLAVGDAALRVEEDAEEQPRDRALGGALPAVLFASHFLLCFGLLRGIAKEWRVAESPAPASRVAAVAGLSLAAAVVGPLLASLRAEAFRAPAAPPLRSPVEFCMPGGTGAAFLLALLLAWWAAQRGIEGAVTGGATSSLTRLTRRRFYVDEMAWLAVGLPLQLLAILFHSLEHLLEEPEGASGGAAPTTELSSGSERSNLPWIALFLIAATVSLLLWNM